MGNHLEIFSVTLENGMTLAMPIINKVICTNILTCFLFCTASDFGDYNACSSSGFASARPCEESVKVGESADNIYLKNITNFHTVLDQRNTHDFRN